MNREWRNAWPCSLSRFSLGRVFGDIRAPVGKHKGNDTMSNSPGRDGTTQDDARMAGMLKTFGSNTSSERIVSGQAQAWTSAFSTSLQWLRPMAWWHWPGIDFFKKHDEYHMCTWMRRLTKMLGGFSSAWNRTSLFGNIVHFIFLRFRAFKWERIWIHH